MLDYRCVHVKKKNRAKIKIYFITVVDSKTNINQLVPVENKLINLIYIQTILVTYYKQQKNDSL